jgi:copper transport protein
VRTRVLLPLLLVLAVVAPAGPVGAHAEPRESDPPADGTAPTGQDEVTITFISMDPEVPAVVEVEGPDGGSITTGQTTVAETTAAGTTVIVPVEPFEEGQHVVSWEAMSSDGDGLSTGTFEFTAEQRSTSGPGIWLIWIVALAIPAAILLRPGAKRKRAD